MQIRWWQESDEAWIAGENPRDLSARNIEVWKLLPNNEHYAVSNLGRVASRRRGAWSVLKGTRMHSGYKSVGIYADKKVKTRLIHQLVLEAFVGPRQEGQTDTRHLNHEDPRRKEDNRLCMLAWGTKSENMSDVLAQKRAGTALIPTETEGTSWYQGYTSDDYLVSVGLAFFHARKLTAKDLSQLWRCSESTADNILRGSRAEVLKPDGWRESYREGECHYKSGVEDETLTTALRLYTEHKWSGAQFSRYLGISQLTGHEILKGRNRKGAEKPEGFMYPWPESASRWALRGENHPSTSLTREQVERAFERVTSGAITTAKQLSQELGLSRSATYALIKGKSWSGVSRPTGLAEKLTARKKGP